MKIFLSLSMLLLVLSACSLHANPNRAKINIPGGSIEIDDDNHNERFCPPGQAKKGNC